MHIHCFIFLFYPNVRIMSSLDLAEISAIPIPQKSLEAIPNYGIAYLQYPSLLLYRNHSNRLHYDEAFEPLTGL